MGGGGLSLFLCQRWAIAILRIKDIQDLGNGTCAITFHEPESELEFSHPWPQPVVDPPSAYTFQNAYEFLDEQDEWYQDGDKIYYYSENGAPQNVTIPALTTLLNIEGSEQTPVQHLTIENIRFENSAWLRPNLEGHVTLQAGFRMLDAYKLPIEGLYHKATLENQAWIARAETAVGVKNCRNIAFKNCTFEHLSATALDLIDNVSSSEISNCHFQDIGGTALQLGTFGEGSFETHIPYIPTDKSKLCNNILIKGNTIHNATNEDWGCVGISAGYVKDVTIEDNHIYNLNYSGICVGWGWTKLDSSMKHNIIRRNKVHDFAQQLYDAGGIYTLSYQPESQIVDNEIYNIGAAPYATNDRAFYIYFDEATDGFLVKGNKFSTTRPLPNTPFGYNKPGPNMKIEDKP
ncbi:MAG: right-handed parallel beta-helix repeat-containing protein [Prevotella sp.]|nr:right-handed parallel beta-helix repeat-containing protein [Prevotella sp.]